MSENETLEFKEVIDTLLNEDELFSLRERRNNSRKTFVRPIQLVFADNAEEVLPGFTRDLSDGGLGLIHKFEVSVGDLAQVTINRLWDGPVTFLCKACWCTSGQTGWYQSGWKIESVESWPDV